MRSKCWQLYLSYAVCRWYLIHKLEDGQDSVEPLTEPERFIHYGRRKRRLTYPIPSIASELVTHVARVEHKKPIAVWLRWKGETWQFHMPLVWFHAFKTLMLVKYLKGSKVWCNFCTLIGISEVYRTRIHKFISKISL